MLKKDAVKPLYRQMMDSLLAEIQDGTYKEGDRIPTEPELAAHYHVSRITVRRTIEELCQLGYLNKKQGKGTFVCLPKIQRKLEVQKNMSFSDTCRMNGRIPSSHVVSFTKTNPDPVCANFLQLTEEDTIFLTERILSADHIPIIYDTIYLNPIDYPDFDSGRLENGSLYKYLKEHYNLTMADDCRSLISVTPASSQMAEALHIPFGEPLMVLESFMKDAHDAPMLFVREFIVGSRYQLSI